MSTVPELGYRSTTRGGDRGGDDGAGVRFIKCCQIPETEAYLINLYDTVLKIMAATTGNEAKISLKILVHKKKNRVLFAEAGSDFVDILFSFMTLPLGTIVRILEKRHDEKMEPLGSLKNLYRSLVDLPVKHLASEESKFMMLNPRSSLYDHCRKLKLIIDDTEPIRHFMCPDCDCTNYGAYFSACNLAKCRHCGKLMNSEIKLKSSTKKGSDLINGSVFVSDVTTFIVTDDLRVIFILLEGALLFKYPLTYMVLSHKHLNQTLVNPRQGTAIEHLTKNDKSTISKQMALKVTLRKSDSKFLFAEADQDFVDFVFGFLEIPLGTLVGKLFNGTTFLESLDNLYASISNMSADGYIKSQDLKDMLIQPQLAWRYVSQNQIFPLNVSNGSLAYCHSYLYYTYSYRDVTYDKTTDPAYEEERFNTLILKDPRVQGRYLKAPAKFLLTDDLILTPLSTFSTIAMLNKLKVPLNDVKELEVTIGIEEGLKILRSSLKSMSALSDALLKRK
ncbi:hypothetical protein CTI12_AA117030 [Artemisia annua]|uniref:DUF674 family protein n=1 Tax=Artemisia annua TaxID=35608 RepID=A0A2U1PSU5_ARTAN|nr:hypothetical protein CTI12_AA117030 [Artemisia annua]